MLRLRRYDIQLEYIPGEYLIVADTLSRAHGPEAESNTEEEIQLHVDMVRKTYPVSDPVWDRIRVNTDQDPELQAIKNAMNTGWELPMGSSLKPYYHFREMITEVDGVLVKGSKIIIPRALRPEMLDKIHEGHMEIEKCQARARQVMYWPNSCQHIEHKVNRCSVCQQFRYRQPKEPLQQHEVPSEPWLNIGADLFNLNGSNYLVVVDYTSNY